MMYLFAIVGALLHLAPLAHATPVAERATPVEHAGEHTSINLATMTPLPKYFRYHENRIKFEDFGQAELESISFRVEDFQISAYQDPDEHNKIGDWHNNSCCANGYQLMFSSGRHGTELVADWWNTRLTHSMANFNNGPKKLNFAFAGEMNITWSSNIFIRIKDMYIGQGRTLTANNWWIGGRNCNNLGTHCLVACYGTDRNNQPVSVEMIRGIGCHSYMDWGTQDDAVALQNYKKAPKAA